MEDRPRQRNDIGVEPVTATFNTARQEIAHVAVAPPRIRPGQRSFNCEVCRFMRDTGERAPQCRCNWVECGNPQCPAGQPEANGRKLRLKSRFCAPTKCRFFEANNHVE